MIDEDQNIIVSIDNKYGFYEIEYVPPTNTLFFIKSYLFLSGISIFILFFFFNFSY